MRTTAAVLLVPGKPLEIAEIEIPKLKAGQVLVKVMFSPVCHTQLLEARGCRGEDPFLPHCLGHEGSGVVEDIGPSISKVKVGDAVILSWMKSAGAEVSSTVYRWNGRSVNSGAITTFAHDAVISENRVVPVSAGISMRAASVLGCAMATGAGAVFNTAEARPGEAVAIFGVGGVGLCAAAAAAIIGCTPIIAVDVRDSRLALARDVGATDTLNSERCNVTDAIDQLVPSGIDVAIEASGRPSVMKQALASVRARGGRAVVIGNARHGERLELDPREFNQGKRLLGTWGGDNRPDEHFPRYCRLVKSGRFNPEMLLSRTYGLQMTNEALDDLESGRAARPLIDMSIH